MAVFFQHTNAGSIRGLDSPPLRKPKKPNMKTFEFLKYLTFRNETLQFTFLFNLKTFPRSQETLTHQV